MYGRMKSKLNLRFQHFTSEEGLVQNSINAIIQDKKGFIWLGTQQGLNKFNGYTFDIYGVNPDNANNVNSDFILCLYEDKKGIIWIGTNIEGLKSFNPYTECFNSYLVDVKKVDNFANTINCIYENSSGQLLIGTNGSGVKVFDRKTKLFSSLNINVNDETISKTLVVNDIFEDRTNKLWLATNDGIIQVSSENGKVKKVSLVTKKHEKSINKRILSIYEDKAGNLWFGSDAGLYLFKPATNKFIHKIINVKGDFFQSSNKIQVMFEDSFGKFWIGTEYGLHLFNRKKGSFQSYFANRNDSFSLNGNSIKTIFEDKSGALWVGLDGRGLDKLNLKNRLFKHYYSNPKNPNKINDHMVFALYEDRAGWLWIGTFGDGLNVYNRKTGEFKNYRNLPNNPDSISSNAVWAICEDRNKRLWVGTANGGVNRFSRKTGVFTHYLHKKENPNSLSDNVVSSIIEDSKGVIWVATNGGINQFIPKINGFKHYKHQAGNKKSLLNNMVYVLFEDREGIIWAGTAVGISSFAPQTGVFTSYGTSPNKDGDIIGNPVFSIFQDKHGLLWIGSIGGLIRLNPKTKDYTFFRKKDGLPNDVINGILGDDDGNLWISTNLGLSRYNIATKKFRNYSQQDGLQSFEFNGGAYYKSMKGEFFFGGINGFNTFFPEKIKDNSYISPVLISGLKVFGEKVKIGAKVKGSIILNHSILDTNEIVLTHKQYSFSLEFVALNYIGTKNNEYAYIMEGLEDNWNYIGRRRFVTYANLAPGHYVFRVKASNNNGVWNEKGTSIKICIIPAFWKTWWFRILAFMFVLLITYIGFQYRNILIKRRKRELEDIVTTRTAVLRESGEKYQTVVEMSMQGILIIKKNIIIFNNSQFSTLLGVNENNVVNNKLSNFIATSMLQEFKKWYDSLNYDKQISGKFETFLRHKNGHEINVEINYNTIEYKQSQAILMFFQDISIKKLLEKERLKIARLESSRNIAKGISHDYNNLLTVILGYLGFVLDEVPKDSRLRSQLLKIEKASLTAADLTQQFLIIAGGGGSITKSQSIIPIIRQTTMGVIEGLSIEYSFDISEDLFPVNCNINDLSQAIKNIVTNAVQSMKTNGKLDVTATNKKMESMSIQNKSLEDYVCIVFKDNGHGILKEDIPNIFDPYFSTRKNVSQKGLGLGLAVVNVIILQHNGFIRVDSELNKGTSVELFLPAVLK